ncbi:MAG: DUF1702 family protein [Candidatus Obscuribacterales bacterium]|nr:DUF1702 family protein [Candidatus Obscuribacterales bacterium]
MCNLEIFVANYFRTRVQKVFEFSGPNRAELMQGILLGASARAKQNAIADHTEPACNMILGETTSDAMRYTEPLTSLLQEREQFTMFDWQSLVRAELRKDDDRPTVKSHSKSISSSSDFF